MSTTDYRSLAKSETTKRLVTQLIHEQLVSVSFIDGIDQLRACITGPGDKKQWMTLPIVDISGLSRHLRPNDLGIPITLHYGNKETTEDDPGSIFEFASSWLNCDERIKETIVLELQNSSAMLEKWMNLGVHSQLLNINSSFLEWERCLVTGHPAHPFHRTCFASSVLSPVTPDDIPGLLNPGISFVAVPRSSVRLFGPFEKFIEPLLDLMGVVSPYDRDAYTVVPCLEKHLPALLHFFPTAISIKTVTDRALAQAAIRTVSVPGYDYDLKFSLACLITSALRVLPCWSAAAAPVMTCLLRKLIPGELWLFGEVAAVTGSQEDTTEARYMTCILRENLESRAVENNESLILAAALLERPQGGSRTYTEILFGLETPEDKLVWLRRYVRKLLKLSLDPLIRHGVGFEFHAQNAVIRVCRKTKAIKGFAIRDLAGVKLHGPTLQDQGFDLEGLEATATLNVHEVWDRVHHALIQNHIGYLLDSLGIEVDGWQVVSFELERALQGDMKSVEQNIYRHFVKETMPFKSFIKMRMNASFKASFKIVDQQIPNVLWKKGPWLRQISLAATKSANALVQPEQASAQIRSLEAKAMRQALLKNTEQHGQLPALTKRLNPHPFVLPMDFISKLETFHEALALALDNIIERWWEDKEANFPNRMPFEPHVESLLRWVAQGSEKGHIKPYKGNQGNLRPDILVPDTKGYQRPQFKVCEINGRFPISFLHYAAIAYQAMSDATWNDPSIKPATDYNYLFDSLFQLFDPKTPIHFVGESSDFPADSPLFGLVEQRTGIRPRSVRPSSLRVVPCMSPNSLDLTSINGLLMEKVHQVGLQLYDFELFALDPDMVREIAKRSVNDIRSIFIAHDKRILGIISQELHDLFHKHMIISEDQKMILEEGIITTIIPGSTELQSVIESVSQDPAIKDKFIMKPFRLARGSGIRFGKNISSEEWQSTLRSMRQADIDSSITQYVLQPVLPLQSVEWFWDEQRQLIQSRMVGLYFSVNGRFIGLGTWRVADVSEDVICSSSKDTTSVMSIIYNQQ
ncbi:aerobactin siderophore [Fusarium sporotrichioides]|uniref:Aerobactin siderophore n=1 Tax=Fusarium sporotrichioides TaxID=5514 RepID=A0A395SC98_FUSSP|nr:aerobactin siderophore [Fusarium sporotrichioides]